MPGLESAVGVRVVAAPDALDRATSNNYQVGLGQQIRIRIAPDEALWLGPGRVDVDDPHAIVEPEVGYSIATLLPADERHVTKHIEFEVPVAGSAATLVQGKVAGVPAKLVVASPTVLIVQTCYVHDLRSRLGW